MLLRPARVELGVMSVRVGLAVADAVDTLLGRLETRLKWPNDVLLAERKLAGILCEGRWQGEALQWLAVGVGVKECNVTDRTARCTSAAVTRDGIELCRETNKRDSVCRTPSPSIQHRHRQ